MTQFTVVIDGKEFTCEGVRIDDINPGNGRPYSVFHVSKMVRDGQDVASYLPVKDRKLRSQELADRQAKLDAAWSEKKATLMAGNPNIGAEELAAHEAHFRGLPSNRILTSNLTSGLTASIIDESGVPYSAYFMRETANQFRTFTPKVTEMAEAEPF